MFTAALGAAALVLAGGGAYALASSNGSTITVCARHHGGTLYKARACAKQDNKVIWTSRIQGDRRVKSVPHGSAA